MAACHASDEGPGGKPQVKPLLCRFGRRLGQPSDVHHLRLLPQAPPGSARRMPKGSTAGSICVLLPDCRAGLLPQLSSLPAVKQRTRCAACCLLQSDGPVRQQYTSPACTTTQSARAEWCCVQFPPAPTAYNAGCYCRGLWRQNAPARPGCSDPGCWLAVRSTKTSENHYGD